MSAMPGSIPGRGYLRDVSGAYLTAGSPRDLRVDEACDGLGIVARQVDRGTLPDELLDACERRPRGRGVGRDAVSDPVEHELLGVRGVGREEEHGVAGLERDREMARRVAGRGH